MHLFFYILLNYTEFKKKERKKKEKKRKKREEEKRKEKKTETVSPIVYGSRCLLQTLNDKLGQQDM